MSEQSTQSVQLEHYLQENWKLVKVNPKTKGGVGLEWQKKEVSLEALCKHLQNGGGVGAQMGNVSNGLSVVDPDNKYAILLAHRFLPATLTQAKGDEPPSHFFFYSPGLNYEQFRDLNGIPLMDIKASDNDKGHLVVLEPTQHPSKGRYRFVGGFNPAAIACAPADELRHRARLLACAALIAQHLPNTRAEGGGGRHDLSLALAGFGLRHGWMEEEAEKVLVSAWEVRGAPREAIDNVRRNVRDTAEKHANDELVTGGGRLEEKLPGIRARIAKNMGWQQKPSDPNEPGGLVEDAVEGIPAPEGLMVPNNCVLSHAGITAIRFDKKGEQYFEDVASAPIIISGRTIDIADNKESAQLLFKRGGRWAQHTAARSSISTTRDITKLADYGVPVSTINAPKLIGYLQEFDTLNINNLPVARTSSRMGWQGSEGFLWGKRLITAQSVPGNETDIENLKPEDWPEHGIMFRGADAGDEQLAAGFTSGGTFETWLAIAIRLTPFPIPKLAIVASLAAPVLTVVKGHNFILDLSNPTSRGKTATARIAGSTWGDPDERSPDSVVGTWDATRVWIERASAVLNNLPLLLDDTKRARRPRDVAQTLYDVASGRGRGRGSKQGLGRSGSWSTVLISTGEQPATSFTEDGGTRARVLTIWGSPFGVVDEDTGKLVAELDLAARENYGHAGPRLVKHLLQFRDKWAMYRQIHTRYKREYTDWAAGNPILGRMADYFATLRLTADLSTSAKILPWGDFDPIDPLWDNLAGAASEADRAVAALQVVFGWASANQHSFYGREREDSYSNTIPPNQGYAGKWDKEDWQHIFFYPHVIKDLLAKHGFDSDAILRTWKERGWLETEKGETRNTKRVRLGGERAHVIAISRIAFEEVD